MGALDKVKSDPRVSHLFNDTEQEKNQVARSRTGKVFLVC